MFCLSRAAVLLESHEVVKLARYAVALKEFLTMAAERVLRRAGHSLLPFPDLPRKSCFPSPGKPATCEPTYTFSLFFVLVQSLQLDL